MSDSTPTSSRPGAWEPPLPDELQGSLPHYEITGILGRGGMGAVYKGRQRVLEREVAIKVLPPGLASDGDPLRYAERFLQEARAMARLSHPGIVAVYDFGETAGGLLYFVMEFVDGMDVQHYLAHHGGRLAPDVALAIAAHLLDALDYAHARGIVHRDIKPANVLIDREGRIKVADFGLAKAFGEGVGGTSLTMSNVAVGTPDYIAPEALDPDLTPDHRADLYAVGVMLYRMLTGKLPRGAFNLPSELAEGIDPRLDDMIVRALASEPDERHSSAADLRADLDTAASRAMSVSARLHEGLAEAEASRQAAAVPATSGVRRERSVYSRMPPPRSVRGRRSRSRLLWSGGVAAAVLAAAAAFALALWDRGGKNGSEPWIEAPTPTERTGTPMEPVTAAKGGVAATATGPPAFVNSLGMAFATVPGTEVLFCVHQTRWSDYATYAEANPGIDDSWREQTFNGIAITDRPGDHPVVNVSWQDAVAFCEWLSSREGRRYRLPTDRERSFAEGIAVSWEEFNARGDGPAPQEATRFPWGDEWPPPPGSGNFLDASMGALRSSERIIEDYNDSFPTTAPVMSFPPNRFGLHDLCGNVWEWSGDFSTGDSRSRRGASWGNWQEEFLATGFRAASSASTRSRFHGFRIVADESPGPPPTSMEPLVPATAGTLGNDALEPESLHPGAWGSDLSQDGSHIALTDRMLNRIVMEDRMTGLRRELNPGATAPSGAPRWNRSRPGTLASHAKQDEGDGDETWWLWLHEEGLGPRRLVEGFFPSWSEDGETLYFRSPRDSALASLRPFETSVLRIELAHVWNDFPEVSPDGTLAVTAISSSRWLIVREMLTGLELASLALADWRSLIPAWSPDSRRVAFGTHPDRGGQQKGLWLLDVATGEVRQLFSGTVTRPRWSGDGEWFAADFNDHNETRVYRFEELDLLGTALPGAPTSLTAVRPEESPKDATQGTPAFNIAVAPPSPPSAPDAPDTPDTPEHPVDTAPLYQGPAPDLVAALETIPEWRSAILPPLAARDDAFAALAADYRLALEARLAAAPEDADTAPFYRQEIEVLEAAAGSLAAEESDPVESVRHRYRLADLAAKAPEVLLTLRSTWESERSTRLEIFRTQLGESLAVLEADLVRERKLEEAIVVERFRLWLAADAAAATLEEWQVGDRLAPTADGSEPSGISELAAPPLEGELLDDPLLARMQAAYLATLDREVEAPFRRANAAWLAAEEAGGDDAEKTMAAWALANEIRHQNADLLLETYLEQLDRHASRLDAVAVTPAEEALALALRNYHERAAGIRIVVETYLEDDHPGEYALKITAHEGYSTSVLKEFGMARLPPGSIPLRLRDFPANCRIRATFESEGYSSQEIAMEVVGGVAVTAQIVCRLYRTRFAICRVAIGPDEERDLSSQQIKHYRVVLTTGDRLNEFDWSLSQSSRSREPLQNPRFVMNTNFTGSGFLRVTDVDDFDGITVVPGIGYLGNNNGDITVETGIIVVFREVRRVDGELVSRFGKILVEEVTERPSEDIPTIQEL